MDCAKVGSLIARLRREKGLTQKNIAEALGVSPKTVSKWETGMGCPDLGCWPGLSAILGVDMGRMMEGEITPNRPDSGNLNRARFYACPLCGNVLMGTGAAAIFCCGRKLEALLEGDAQNKPALTVEESDGEWYLTVEHPMEKDHHLAFAAYVHSDRVLFIRLYAQQSPAFRLPLYRGGKLYLYCTRHGLNSYSDPFKPQARLHARPDFIEAR